MASEVFWRCLAQRMVMANLSADGAMVISPKIEAVGVPVIALMNINSAAGTGHQFGR